MGATIPPSGDAHSTGVPPTQHLASYDLISSIQDIQVADSVVESSTASAGAAAFFTSCVVGSLITGFGLHFAVNSKKYKEGLMVNSSNGMSKGNQKVVFEDPILLATRALRWGSFFAIIGSGAVGLTAVYIWKL